MSTDDAPLLAAAAAAVLARALFVAADAALGGVSPERAAELLAANGSPARRALHALKSDIEGAGFTTRGGAIASLALAAAVSSAVAVRLYGPSLGDLAAAGIGGLAATAACLVIDLVFRSVAVAHPEGWAIRSAIPTWLAARIVAPLGRRLLAVVGLVLRPFGVRATFRSATPALEDIERYLQEEEDAPEPALVHSLFEFSTTTAREVMVPRTGVVAVPLDIEPAELVQLVAERGHSRMPVYAGEIDRVVGVLHTRDIVPLLAHPELIRVPDLIRPPVFVPWATRIGELLRRMQRDRIQIAMVADEHGGFMGIVTLEDILEELVGELPGETGDSTPAPVPLPDGSFRVDAGISIADFNEAFSAMLPDGGGFDTLAGYLNDLAGAIPETGAVLEGHGLCFTIEERTPRRVLSVRVAQRLAQRVG